MIDELGNNLIPVLLFTLLFLFGTTWVVVAAVGSAFRTWLSVRLKCKLVDRGASVDEIERILAAGRGEGPAMNHCQPRPVPPVKVAVSR